MLTGNIVKFLQAYPDDRLASLRAHIEDGKLSYWSCCCLVGSINPEHGLLREDEYCTMGIIPHLEAARLIPFAVEAEEEFRKLGCNAQERRERIMPFIIAEQERREKFKASVLAVTEQQIEVEA